jgi:hypothetical protein
LDKQFEKQDRIGESHPFRKGTLSVKDEIRPGLESNPRPRASDDNRVLIYTARIGLKSSFIPPMSYN